MALPRERPPGASAGRAAPPTRIQWWRHDTRTGSPLARLRLDVRRAICDIVHHRLASPVKFRRRHGGELLYRTYCTRCDFAALGDWRAMERMHAWQHYRRAL